MSVELFVSPSGVASSYLPAGDLAGFDLHTQLVEADSSIIDQISGAAKALVIEVVADQPGSMNRLREVIENSPHCPILVAVESPSLDDVRTLMHEGVTDILPLPLTQRELEAALGRIKDEIANAADRSKPEGQIISVAKCRGGVGATTIISQLAAMTAQAQGRSGDVCLVDLDVQFGNSALYLGKLPKTGVKDLIDAGNRADAAMLRSLTAKHSSGLNYLAAPLEIMPLNAVDAEQVIYLLDLLASEYGTVFVDLPTNWTNWSLSTIARSDLVLLVGELSIASLHQAQAPNRIFEPAGSCRSQTQGRVKQSPKTDFQNP